MPYLKFDSPKGTSDNKGSCDAFVSYLAKEDFQDKENPLFKEFLFNHTSRLIPDYVAIQAIDGNRKGLGRNDAKFYTGSINFSEEELRFIGNDSDKIKDFAIGVMKRYAENFNRGITIDDLVWYAKVEQNRYYKGDDPEVIAGNRKQGEVKEGQNAHVHFIVGRKTLDGRKKISPKTNHRDTQKGPIKGGFDRDDFKQQCEAIFDEQFGYLRPLDESYQYNRARVRGTVDERADVASKFANELVKRETYLVQTTEQREHRIRQLANYICFGIDKENIKRIDLDQIVDYERQSGHAGHIYRSLVNLNRACKQGKTPSEYDLTEKVLGFAKYLELQGNTNERTTHTKPVIEQNRDKERTPLKVVNPFIIQPSPAVSSSPKRDEDEILKRKRKKKRSQDRDFGMGM